MNIDYGILTHVKNASNIFEEGDNLFAIAYIKDGSIVQKKSGNFTNIIAGSMIGTDDLFSEYYSCTYTAQTDCDLIYIKAATPYELADYLINNNKVHSELFHSINKMLISLSKSYKALYTDVFRLHNSIYSCIEKYLKLCSNLGDEIDYVPKDIMSFENIDNYNFNILEFYDDFCEITGLEKFIPPNFEDYTRQARLITNLFENLQLLKDYLHNLTDVISSTNENCLFNVISEFAACISEHNQDSTPVVRLLYLTQATIQTIDNNIHSLTGITLDIDYNRMNLFIELASAALPADAVNSSQYNNISLESPAPEEDTPAISTEDIIQKINENPQKCLPFLLNYSGLGTDFCSDFIKAIISFKSMKDKYSKETVDNLLRKNINTYFFELYEAVFFKYINRHDDILIVELFLNYGLLDETLITKEQFEYLINITPFTSDGPCKVFLMKDWLLQIYEGKELPSKNEFDQDYIDHIRILKKQVNLTKEAEMQLLNDGVKKVHYEIENVLKYSDRLVNGKITTFYPMLYSDIFDFSIERAFIDANNINESVDKLKTIDYSIFYRESMYSSPQNGINKELIQSEYLPIFILFPTVGCNGIMWQETTGKRSTSNARFFLPSMLNTDLNAIMIKLFARFRWELCKTLQGTSWNNIRDLSLTSEYCDYVQFYRKNHDLSSEKKEQLKSELSKCRNNIREVFIADYITWIIYEASGAVRLNKVARQILATYCPFEKSIREKLSSHPIFEDAMRKYEREKRKKNHEIISRYTALEKKNIELTPELLTTRDFYSLL